LSGKLQENIIEASRKRGGGRVNGKIGK